MAAFHARQYSIRTVLYGQMQVIRQGRNFGIRLNQTVSEFHRVGCCESNSFNALDNRYVIDECCKIGNLSIMHRSPVRIDVLTEKIYLAHALPGKTDAFGDNAIERSAVRSRGKSNG